MTGESKFRGVIGNYDNRILAQARPFSLIQQAYVHLGMGTRLKLRKRKAKVPTY